MKKLPVAVFVAAQQVSGESAAMDNTPNITWARGAVAVLIKRLYKLIGSGVHL